MGTSRSMVLRFDGDKELEAAFNALALGAQKKIFRPALRAGGKVILAAVKARVPKGTGALGRSIKLRASRRSRQRIGVAVFVDNKLIPLGKGEQQHNREGSTPRTWSSATCGAASAFVPAGRSTAWTAWDVPTRASA